MKFSANKIYYNFSRENPNITNIYNPPDVTCTLMQFCRFIHLLSYRIFQPSVGKTVRFCLSSFEASFYKILPVQIPVLRTALLAFYFHVLG